MFPQKSPRGTNLIRDETKNIHHRMIGKNGVCNVTQPVSNRQKLMILRYSKLVDSSWTFTLSIFLAVLFLSWTSFAIFYWLICFTHGDFEPNHLPEFQEKNHFKPCIYDMRDFSSCFLFSMEAQHTLGYGIKAPTAECAEAIFVNSIHCIIGFIMQGFMAAIIFSKMTKPRLRSQTLMFSKKAVISPRNGKLCLMFRVGDIRTRHIVDAKVRVFVVKSTKTQEQETLPYTQTELKMHMDGCSDSIFFNWPIVMYHVLNKDSPLYYLSPSDLCQQNFEIMVVIEGTDENTGQVTQAKSSYMPNEILWGFRFEKLIKFDDLRQEYEVDFSKFDTVVPVNTPLCSAVYNEQYLTMQKANISEPCIYDMRDFSSCFLFSMEAQHTLGYGIKAPTAECAEAIFVNSIHCIIGFIMQGFMAAIIFSKMTKPRLRSQTLMFSKKAVISPRNGKLCLMFRVGDIRTRHIVDAKVRVFVVKSTKTQEQETLPYTQTELKMHMDGCSDSIFFNWPIVMYHVLNKDSPLYYLSPSDLCQQNFEIMVVIEGTDENTGQVTQAKSSYMPNEILWGFRFEKLIKFDDLRQEYEVDFSKFDTVVPVNTPLCSAVYNEQYLTMQKANIRTSSRLKLDFTPRHSLGEIPANQLAKLQERFHTRVNIMENND